MSIHDKIKEKLNDELLYQNLKNFAVAYKKAKSNAYSELDFDKLREEMSQLKELDSKKVMKLFHQFKENAEKAGATVYQAATGDDACQYIADVCKKKGIKTMVKSKSMTSEEIHLNKNLEAEGVFPVETDLGEWILQLSEEHPSHMVMPAIHKTRGQVAELFEDKLGGKVDKEDIDAMVKIAREELRSAYFEAGAGLTGANGAIASTGTIFTVTNEGNARLSATVPPVHFVLVGYEKLIEDFETALKIVRMLPKSATGQNISTYVTWIKGQNQSLKNPTGSKEVHYIFLDNGRLAFMEHPILKEALKCMRCGSCANICPAYEMVGGHVFGHVYIGAIGLILTAMFHGEEKAKEILKMCIGCRACSFNCPSGIDLQKLISELNVYSGEKFGLGFLRTMVYSHLLTNPERFRSAMKIGETLQGIIARDGKIKNIPFMGEKNFRHLPTIAERTFTDIDSTRAIVNKKDAKRVFFYPGCAVEYFFPQMGKALVEILEANGYIVDTPDKSACCGLPAIHAGDGKGGKSSIKTNLALMGNPEDYYAYLVLCPSCGLAIKDDYTHYTQDNPALFQKSGAISKKIVSMANFFEQEEIMPESATDLKVTYHTPCHQKRGLGSGAETLLKAIFGDNFIPMEDSDVCCGFGGSWSVDFATVSKGVLEKKIDHIEATGADIVVTDCPGCVMQIGGGLSKKDSRIKTMHLTEFLREFTNR